MPAQDSRASGFEIARRDNAHDRFSARSDKATRRRRTAEMGREGAFRNVSDNPSYTGYVPLPDLISGSAVDPQRIVDKKLGAGHDVGERMNEDTIT